MERMEGGMWTGESEGRSGVEGREERGGWE